MSATTSYIHTLVYDVRYMYVLTYVRIYKSGAYVSIAQPAVLTGTCFFKCPRFFNGTANDAAIYTRDASCSNRRFQNNTARGLIKRICVNQLIN